jgi:hypothetical protein
VATSDGWEGRPGEATSLGVFVSDDPPFEAWAVAGVGGFSTGASSDDLARLYVLEATIEILKTENEILKLFRADIEQVIREARGE